jgi:hypothetical protein
MVVTKNFLPRFKYDKSKAEEYQLALTANLGKLWVVESIRHLGRQVRLPIVIVCGCCSRVYFWLQTFGKSCRDRHYHKPWLDTDCRITKRELKLWLKANSDSHAAKH